MDHVDFIIRQWQKERPSLDVTPMETVGRIRRLSTFFERGMESTFRKFDLNGASFDVLATLLRSGSPYELTPSELLASTMVTSGTMTNRLDQLEKRHLIRRQQSTEDKRSVSVALTSEGLALTNDAVTEHVKTQHALTKSLNAEEQQLLNMILKKILVSFEE